MSLAQLRQQLPNLRDYTDDELVGAIAQANGIRPDTPQFKQLASALLGYDRTWGEAAKDTGIGLVQGVIGVGQTAATVAGAALPGVRAFDNPVVNTLRSASDALDPYKSAGLRNMEIGSQVAGDIATRQAAAEGAGAPGRIWAGAKAQGAQYIQHPQLAVQDFAQSLPSLYGAGVIGRGAQVVGRGLGLAEGTAARVGVAGGVGGGGVLQGGDVAGDTFDRMRQAGADYDTAASGAAAAGVKGGLASVGLAAIPGATSIERSMIRGAAGVGQGGWRGAARGFAGEFAQEGVEEGYGQFAGNQAVQSVNPSQDLYEGVGRAVVQAGVSAGPLGGFHGSRSHAAVAPTPRTETGEIDLAARAGVNPDATYPSYDLRTPAMSRPAGPIPADSLMAAPGTDGQGQIPGFLRDPNTTPTGLRVPDTSFAALGTQTGDPRGAPANFTDLYRQEPTDPYDTSNFSRDPATTLGAGPSVQPPARPMSPRAQAGATEFDTAPGAAPAQPAVDYTREAAPRAVQDPALTRRGVVLNPGGPIDTAGLALADPAQQAPATPTPKAQPNVGDLISALQKASTDMGVKAVRKDGEVANTAAAAPLREVIQSKNPLEKMRELYQDGKHPRDELLDLWHKELTGQTVAEAKSAPKVNSAGFVTEPKEQRDAQLQALREGRKDVVVLGQEEAAQHDLTGLKTGVATGTDGASAVVVSNSAKKVKAAVKRAKEVGLKQAMGEAQGVANPALTTAPTPDTQVVQQVDEKSGQVLAEQAVTPADLSKVKPIEGTTTRVVSPEQAVTGRTQTPGNVAGQVTEAKAATEPPAKKGQHRDSTKTFIDTVENTKDEAAYKEALYQLYARSFGGNDVRAYNYLDKNGYFDLKPSPAKKAEIDELKARFAAERGQERGDKFGATKEARVHNPDNEASSARTAEHLEGDGADVVRYLAENASTAEDREVAQRIAPYLKGVRVVVADPGRPVPDEIRRHFEGITTASGTKGVARGVTAFDSESGEVAVFLHPELGTKEDVALHELVHAATMRAIDDPRNGALRQELEKTRLAIRHALNRERFNGTVSGNTARRDLGEFFTSVVTDPHEMLAYAFTSPTFRKFLRTLDWDGNPLPRKSAEYRQVQPNMLQRIVNAMRRAFGLAPAYKPYLEKVTEGGEVYTNFGQRTMFQRLDQLLGDTLSGPSPGGGLPSEMKANMAETLRPLAEGAKTITAAAKAQYEGKELNEALLNFMTLRQIEEQYGHKLPAFKDWTAAIFERSSKASKLAAEADRVAQKWQDVEPADQKRLAEILLRASNAELELDNTKADYIKELSPEERREYEDLRAKLLTLPPAAREVRAEALKILKQQWKTTHDSLAKFITFTVQDPGLRQRRLEDLHTEFGRNRGDYFPLSRFGDNIVIARGAAKDGRDVVTFHETVRAADAEVERLKAAGAKHVIRTKATERDIRKVASTGFMGELHNLVDQNTSGAEAEALHEALQQLYLKSLPELSGAKHMIRRENIEGYSTDALRAFADAVSRGARYAAHLEFGPAVHAATEAGEQQSRSADKRTASVVIGRKEDAKPIVVMTQDGTERLAAMEKLQREGYTPEFFSAAPETVVERLAGALEDADEKELARLGVEFKKLVARSDSGVEDLRAAKQLYNYMVRSQQVALGPQQGKVIGEKGVELAGQLGYAWYLGFSPAFWAMNSLQNPMIGIPHLGGKYGTTKAAGELFSAAKWFAQVRLSKFASDRSTPFSVDYLREQVAKGELKGLNKQELEMLQRLEDRQVLDFTQAMDLTRIGAASNSTWYKAMRWAAAGAHHTEVFNRVSFALAAYRLALKSGSAVTHEEAVRAAERDVAAVHFDYSYANKPMWMGKSLPGLRLVFMFQQYRQHMLYWWAKTIKDATKGLTPEERSQARKAALLMGVSHLTFAGAMGLPFVGAVATLANLLGGGDDGEEPFDFERWLREAAVGVTGSEKGGELLTKGIFTTLGMDISKRIGQADLLPLLNPGSARFERDFDDKTRAYLFDMLGPLGSLALGAARSVEAFHSGDPMKAATAVAPKALADVLRAVEQGNNGLKDKRGQHLAAAEAFDGADWLMQAAGVTPMSVANVKAARGAVMDIQAQLKDQRSRLAQNFVEAWSRSDTEGLTDALAAIQKYNANVAKNHLGDRTTMLTGEGLKVAIMDRQRRAVMLAVTGGLADSRHQLQLAARVSGAYDLGGRDAAVELIGKQYGLPGLPALPGAD